MENEKHLEQFRRVEAVTKLVPQVGAAVFGRIGFRQLLAKKILIKFWPNLLKINFKPNTFLAIIDQN